MRKIAWDSSTLGLVTCAPRLGVNVTSCTAASRCSTFLNAGAAHGEHLGQRLFRQFAARRQLMFDDSRHQRLVNAFVLVLQRWRGLETMFIIH
ncbi:Uncharacterised protein [Klebsiella pneumoniae]|uniref:Uncharacterized protein n=1 Tax=Klebsiella pneumoniae TaxID=573 RepID=A0A2X3DS97_KLEPN|nr:Uncharacterised protein [Klebsiella pneumoniae]